MIGSTCSAVLRAWFVGFVFAACTACERDDSVDGTMPPAPAGEIPARVDPANPLLGVEAAEEIASGHQFTEGPAWDRARNRLLFTDIPANRILSWSPATGSVEVVREPSRNANGLAFDGSGRLYICEHGGRRVSVLPTDADEPTTLVEQFFGKLLNSPNDLAVRDDGHVYFTDPPYGLKGRKRELAGNNVFHLTPDRELSILWEGEKTSRPNGLALSPDGTRLFVAFTDTGTIFAFDVDRETGAAPTYREFAQTEGNPDGMAIDIAGNLFVATQAGIEAFAPNGSRWGTIELPQRPANCAFGDADGRGLYATARTSVYRIRLNTIGKF